MAYTQQNRQAEIITPLGTDVLLIKSMSMQEELGRLFNMSLELLSTDENINFEALLGQNVTLRLDLFGGGQRYFNGFVSRISQVDKVENFAVYQATVKPWLWFLTRTSDCKIFQHQTVPDIIQSIFSELGFTDVEAQLSGSYRTWDYCVQYRETDFNFVSRLMEQEGIYYYFKHEIGKHTLVLSDGYGSHEVIPGYAELRCLAADSAAEQEEEHIFSWRFSKQVQPGAYVQDDYDFKSPKTELQTELVKPRSHSEAHHEIYDYPGEYLVHGDGQNYTKARLEELQAQYEQCSGQGGARGLYSGGLFSLTEYPRADQNREYLLVSVTHHLQMDSYETSGGGGTLYENDFSVIESKTPFRTPRKTPKPMVQGPQTAVVVGPAGEEIHTDEHGRVIVQFHWDRLGQSDGSSSCWVRVAQVWAGKNWGGIHIPRIGQEVIVEFLEGDPDRPIVTGRVYNGTQVPPYDLPANKTQSGIKSRSSMGGSGANFNEIRMEDKKGSEQLYVHAEKNQDNIVEANETTNVGHDRTEDVGHDETIKIGNNRTEKVAVNEDITIGGNRTEQVMGNEDITILGNRQEMVLGKEDLTITGPRTLTAISGETRTVTGSRTHNIMGTQSETIIGPLTQTISSAENVNIGGARNVTIGGVNSLTVGGVYNLQVGAAKLENIGAGYITTVGGPRTVSSSAYIIMSPVVIMP